MERNMTNDVHVDRRMQHPSHAELRRHLLGVIVGAAAVLPSARVRSELLVHSPG